MNCVLYNCQKSLRKGTSSRADWPAYSIWLICIFFRGVSKSVKRMSCALIDYPTCPSLHTTLYLNPDKYLIVAAIRDILSTLVTTTTHSQHCHGHHHHRPPPTCCQHWPGTTTTHAITTAQHLPNQSIC